MARLVHPMLWVHFNLTAYCVQHMAEQEKKHLKKFDELMERYRVRPTVLTPLWRVAGFTLGAGTALMGREAAMACTVSVETTVGEHYNDQLRTLHERNMNSPSDAELRQVGTRRGAMTA